MVTRLTPHFTLEELIATSHRSIDNTPPPAIISLLKETAERMEEVRQVLRGQVITVSSGYRSEALNRAVGGSKTSAHTLGLAVDFNCYGAGDPLQVARLIAASPVAYDQLIHEYGRWVHISFDRRMRQMDLTIDRFGTRSGLLPIR